MWFSYGSLIVHTCMTWIGQVLLGLLFSFISNNIWTIILVFLKSLRKSHVWGCLCLSCTFGSKLLSPYTLVQFFLLFPDRGNVLLPQSPKVAVLKQNLMNNWRWQWNITEQPRLSHGLKWNLRYVFKREAIGRWQRKRVGEKLPVTTWCGVGGMEK